MDRSANNVHVTAEGSLTECRLEECGRAFGRFAELKALFERWMDPAVRFVDGLGQAVGGLPG